MRWGAGTDADGLLQGLMVPEVLRKYIPGNPEFIPFSKELPKDTTSAKVKAKADKGAKPKVTPAPADAGQSGPVAEATEKLEKTSV